MIMVRNRSTATPDQVTPETPEAPRELAIDLTAAVASFPPSRAAMALARPMRVNPDDRSASQKYFDGLVKQGHDEWISTGKPVKWADQPGIFVTVKTDDVEDARKLARKGAVLYDVRLRFGLATENKGDDGEPDGTTTIVFSVTDKKVRANGEAAETDEDDSDSDENVAEDESQSEVQQETDQAEGDASSRDESSAGDAPTPEWSTE
jgi:hypothetical protein